jgi:hypothetical protein
MVLASKPIEEKDQIRGLIGYSGSYTFRPFSVNLIADVLAGIFTSESGLKSYRYHSFKKMGITEFVYTYLRNYRVTIRNVHDEVVFQVKGMESSFLHPLILERLERLEEGFSELVESTWNYIFKEDAEEIKDISKEMLEDSRVMRESFKRLKDNRI